MNEIESDGFITVYDSAGAPDRRSTGDLGTETPQKTERPSVARSGGASDLRCHDYAPDIQAQGDCINCGWGWEYHQ